MRSTEREFVELLPATALSGWPFRAIQRWLAPTADIKQVSIGKPQAGGGDQAVRSMWMWCFSEQWWGNKYGKSEHGKATNIVNKVTRSKQPNFEDLESWQLSLAVHSPTVLSGFLTAQITNQHQVFFSTLPRWKRLPVQHCTSISGQKKGWPSLLQKKFSVHFHLHPGYGVRPWYVQWFCPKGTKNQVYHSISVSGFAGALRHCQQFHWDVSPNSNGWSSRSLIEIAIFACTVPVYPCTPIVGQLHLLSSLEIRFCSEVWPEHCQTLDKILLGGQGNRATNPWVKLTDGPLKWLYYSYIIYLQILQQSLKQCCIAKSATNNCLCGDMADVSHIWTLLLGCRAFAFLVAWEKPPANTELSH